MRLLKLKFQNLNSLVGMWEIDFTHEAYLQNGLFVITGPTGAGKTTILDALTLALYGQTVRLNKITQTRNEIMSLNTRDCMAEVHFEIRGTSYYSRWEQHFAKKGKRELQPPKKHFGTSDDRFGCTKDVETEVKKVVGLEFSQFRQSIMLAQNGFAAFLNADVQQRKEILEKITSTEHFRSLARTILERKGLEERKFQEFQTRMEAISLLDEADVAEKKAAYVRYQTRLEKEMPPWEKRLEVILSWMKEMENAQQQQDDLNQEKVVLEKEWELFQPQQIQLENGLRAQKVQEICLRRNFLRQTFENLSREIRVSEENEQQWNVDLQKSQIQWETTQQILKEVRLEVQQWENVFREVEKLDTQIQNDQQKWEETQRKLLEKRGQSLTLEEKCRNLQQEKEKLEAKKAALQTYLKEHASDAPLEQEYGVLDILIQQLESFRTSELETLKGAYAQKTSQKWALVELECACQNAEETLQNATLALETHQEQLVPSQYISLQNEIKQIEAFREVLKNLAQKENEIANGKANQQAWEKERQQKKEELETLEEEYRKVKESQKHVSLEKYRQELTLGEPCPLCGSREHPWHEKTVECSESGWESLRKKERELAERRIELEVEEKDLARRIENLPLETWERERIQEWNQRGMFLRDWGWSETWLPEEVETSLLQKESHLAAEKEKWNHWQETLVSLKQTFQEAENEFKKKKEILVLRTQLDQKQEEFDQKELDLKQKISPFFTGETWKQPVSWTALGESLRKRLENWKAYQKNFQQAETELQQKQTELVEITETCRLITQQLTELQKQETAEKETLNKRRQERLACFGDKDLAKERQKWQERLQQAAQNVANSEKEKALLQQKIDSETTLRNEKAERLKQTEQEKESCEAEWTQKLREEGFADEDRLKEAFLDAEVLETLLKKRNELQQRQHQWQGRWAQNEHTWKNLQQNCPTQRSREVILRKLESYRDARTYWTEQKAVLAGQLAENEERKKLAEAQQQEFLSQKKILERWQNLYECIGAVDGKGTDSFTSFAQNLVFGILLDHANEQLAYLSPRYRLCLEPTKRLEIYLADTYHQGITRPAANLSGGETFLVSLALALGLTRMVSREIQIHSFFLDEGFGTLDEHSLHRALEALERYHTQEPSGKLIGIISHVETLKERIGTKIEVIPLSPGISKLVGPGVRRL